MRTLLIILILAFAAPLFAQTRTFPVDPATFDGGKFKADYGLSEGDFWIRGNQLIIRDGVTLPETPVLKAPDSPAVVSRNIAKAAIDRDKILRAIVLIVLDEFNAHASKTNAILDAVDNALTLADLKARIALIPDYPQRTSAQLITAIKNSIDSGAAD